MIVPKKRVLTIKEAASLIDGAVDGEHKRKSAVADNAIFKLAAQSVYLTAFKLKGSRTVTKSQLFQRPQRKRVCDVKTKASVHDKPQLFPR